MKIIELNIQEPRVISRDPLENKESRWVGLHKLEYSDQKEFVS